jgi:hypothetical protein
MKHLSFFLILVVHLSSLFSQESLLNLNSPDNKIVVKVNVTSDGVAVYKINFNGAEVLGESSLGICLYDADFSKGLSVESVSEIKPTGDTYQLISDKRKQRTYFGNERTVRLVNSKSSLLKSFSGLQMTVCHFAISYLKNLMM